MSRRWETNYLCLSHDVVTPRMTHDTDILYTTATIPWPRVVYSQCGWVCVSLVWLLSPLGLHGSILCCVLPYDHMSHGSPYEHFGVMLTWDADVGC